MNKKLFASIIFAAVFAAAASAEITFAAWVTALPFVGSQGHTESDSTPAGSDFYLGMTDNDGSNVADIGLGIRGATKSGIAGFETTIKLNITDWNMDGEFRFNTDDGAIQVEKGDVALALDDITVWIQPIEQVKISFGAFRGDYADIRGDFTFGSWDWIRPGNYFFEDEGFTMTSIAANGGGVMLELFPLHGLRIWAKTPLFATSKESGPQVIVQRIQAGAGYTIDGIGRIKAQWVGSPKRAGYGDESTHKWGDAEISFDLYAVKNLTLAFGATAHVGDHAWHGSDIDLKIGVSYLIGDSGLTLILSGGVPIYGVWTVNARGYPNSSQNNNNPYGALDLDPWGFQVGLGFEYAVPQISGLTFTGDARFCTASFYYGTAGNLISSLFGVKYAIGSNAVIGAGFQISTVQYMGGAATGNVRGFPCMDQPDDPFNTAITDPAWAVPLYISVWL